MRKAFRRLMCGFVIAVSLMGTPRAEAKSDVASAPGWNIPAPGTQAFIGTNGNHAEAAVICKSLADFRAREDSVSGHPTGCVKIKSGTLAIIKGLIYDPGAIFAGGHDMPIAEIYIPSSHFIGYVTLFRGLVPRLPQGQAIVVRGAISGFRLARSQEDLSGAGRRYIGAKIKIIRQDAAIGEGGRDLYVALGSDGRARTGWLLGSSLNGKDGNPLEEFKYAIVDRKHEIPKSFLIRNFPKSLAGSLNDRQRVAPFDVPRGNADFMKYVDYYANGNYAAGAAVRCGLRGNKWESEVFDRTILLLVERANYDYPLSDVDQKRALNSVRRQLLSSIKAGLHAPYSICPTLGESQGFLLAESITQLAGN